MNKLQKIAISLIPLSGLMAAETAMAVGKLAAPFGAGLVVIGAAYGIGKFCLLYTSPSPRDGLLSRMPSSA